MSRSYKKVPIRGITTAASDKKAKKLAHKKFRRKSKDLVNKIDPYEILHSDFCEEVTDVVLPEKLEEVYDIYGFDKEGKKYVKNPKEREKILRK